LPPWRPLLTAGLLLSVSGCSLVGGLRRQAASPVGLSAENRESPALSGDGRLLASLVERGGRTTVILQERSSGKMLPLRHLRSHQPHQSPSLSWNGRYLALLIQQGQRRQAVVEDRASGQLHPLFLPGGMEPQSLSLAPDGQRIALAVNRNGSTQVQVFDLSGLLEADRAPGQKESGGGPEGPP